ncbi:TnsA-like heteromeric transposase endonuclease subunit [Actinoplanes sp. NBC_00393]|uniref:TnsA-like heteromeric transposase endonuclease subunit n=1 Tax=Actinoplanes sp. NBC_00393 TaxID=2975953 RepID=UPI002E1E0BB5
MAVDSSMGAAVALAAGRAGAPVPLGRVQGGFEIGFLAEDGTDCRVALKQAWQCRLEWCRPVRQFPQYKGQRHFPGRWWTATMGCHVGYESWLERDHLMLLDFDPAVVAVASQPFWLFWTMEQGKARSHVPDYFARLVDGSAVVVDCRPADRIRPRDAAAFAATRDACDQLGWHYRVVGATDVVLTRNVRWLAGYRHPRHRVPAVAEALQRVFVQPAALMAGGEAVGDPIAVLPTLFHLLWHRELLADLSMSLHPDTTVRAAAAGVPA